MSKREKILVSVNSDKLQEFKDYGDTVDLSRNKVIISLASTKLNELKEAKKV